MKTIVLFSLIPFFITCQNKHEIKSLNSYEDSLCVVGEKIGMEDFQKSKLRLSAERITGNVYDSLLFSDYNIQTYDGQKRDDFFFLCYHKVMDSLLSIKFNQDILLATYYKSQKIEYLNRTGNSPDSIEVIDLSDQMQESYLGCFIKFNSKTSKFQESRNKIKRMLLNEGLNPNDLNIKLEIDTNGKVASIYSRKQIKDRIKTQIIQEMNMYEEIGYFEMDGERKNFIVTFISGN